MSSAVLYRFLNYNQNLNRISSFILPLHQPLQSLIACKFRYLLSLECVGVPYWLGRVLPAIAAKDISPFAGIYSCEEYETQDYIDQNVAWSAYSVGCLRGGFDMLVVVRYFETERGIHIHDRHEGSIPSSRV